MKVRVKLAHPLAKMPKKAFEDDACFDLFSVEKKWIPSNSLEEVNCGIHIEIPKGWVGLIRPRSSFIRKGCVVQGTIDAGYRGYISVFLNNTGKEPLSINVGDRIGQIFFTKVHNVKMKQVKELSKSKRGERGFGSSGK